MVLIREGWQPQLPALPELLAGVNTLRVATATVFDGVADTEHPAGILVVLSMPAHPIAGDVDLLVLVDQVRDPGNLGTLIRSAAAFGATCLLLTPATVDPYHPKTVRAAMGAHFAISIGALDAAWRERLSAGDVQVVVSRGDGGNAPDEIDWCRPSVLVIGNEATGVSDEVEGLATTTVTIPMHGQVESLNAGIAGAVILSEVARQRRQLGRTGPSPPDAPGISRTIPPTF